jgi:hypothetical protein
MQRANSALKAHIRKSDYTSLLSEELPVLPTGMEFQGGKPVAALVESPEQR